MNSDRTFEREDPMADAYLVDPGPIPGVRMTRPMERETRRAMSKVKPTPMRKGVDK